MPMFPVRAKSITLLYSDAVCTDQQNLMPIQVISTLYHCKDSLQYFHTDT